MAKPITEKRIEAMYKLVDTLTSNNKDELLSYLLATISHKQVKDMLDYLVENLGVKIEME